MVKKIFHPVVYILFLWMLFSSPFLFFGKVPFASSYQITFFSPWSAYPHNGIPVKNAAMPDVIGQIFPWKHLVISMWKQGEIPLWNEYSFGGTPLLANYQSAVLSPLNLIFSIFPFIDAWSLLVLLQPLLAGLFTYWYSRKVGISHVGSLLSSIAFMFCGFLVTWMGYATLGYALLFLPLGLVALEGYFSIGKARYLFLLSLVLPLSFFSGHFQISLYVAFTLFVYWMYKTVSSRSVKKGSITLLYFFCGILLSLPQLLPSLEFYTQSLRSGLYQRSEVIPWVYVSTFLAPDFFGNPVTRNDWFGHYAEWNGYIGIIIFFLSLLGVSAWKKSIVAFLAIGGIVALLFALPTPLGDGLVWLHIPVLATSAASRIISIYCFFFAVLAGFGWDRLIEFIDTKKWMKIGIWMVVCVVLLAILWLVVLVKLWMPLDKIGIAKQNLVIPSLIFGLMAISSIVSFITPKKYKVLCLSICFIVLVSTDSLRFATKWQAFDPKSFVTQQAAVVSAFQKIQGYQRALGSYGAEVSNYYQLPSLEGYDALYPKRFGEFIASLSNGKLQESGRSVVSFPRDGLYAPQAINVLNVVYIIHKVSDTGKVWAFPYWNYPPSQFSLVYNDGVYQILKNNAVFPRAFLVGSYALATNPQKILDIMFAKTTNLRKKIVLEEKPTVPIADDPSASSSIVSYTPNKITIATSSKANMLLFLSDSYYPGWKAYVDGKEAKIYRADFAFRAIAVPSGQHMVTFSYFPNSFLYGLMGAGVGLIGICYFYLIKPFRVDKRLP